MSRDAIDDAPDVDKKGLSAAERDHQDHVDRLYRWMKSVWRRN